MNTVFDQALWAVGRGSGVVAMVLLTLSVLLGIGARSGRPVVGIPRFAVTLVHRNVSLFSLIFVVVHVVSLLFDPFAQLRLVDFFVPFLGAFKPFWLGLGTIAFDLLVVVTVTGLLRNRIGPRVFKAVHWLVYAMWPVSLVHAMGNGTNGLQPWFLVIAMLCLAAVGGALAWRLHENFVEYRNVRSQENP
ncbi:ferric reductase-like transmembrane domain-containing protein [Arthrobacter sp. B2a2-09]|uniref:ferric reductase-like transmembrane domain-containing protein n=1 Tax=Arthrobacter sp. B2a2-09 TaxID=2952822 RepID=UPI0022CDAA14|nr:ferric reductase-like transmembrane domain-containing protein [Arthrobacter sp. B2a2-09]MCZ9880369.1 ferric reductase-like transmembrane domain-containing protein [Arthrobacter sp. B2a2-09]